MATTNWVITACGWVKRWTEVSQVTGGGIWEYSVHRYLHYTCNNRVLSEGGLRRVKVYIVNSRAAPKHNLKSSVSNMPREGIMESHEKHNEIQWKQKYRGKKKQRTDTVNRNAAVANMVPINPIISIITSTENGLRQEFQRGRQKNPTTLVCGTSHSTSTLRWLKSKGIS